MRIAYFDCFAGISGEMLLGALLHAGLSLDALQQILSQLPFSDRALDISPAVRKELSGTLVHIVETPRPPSQALQHHVEPAYLTHTNGTLPAPAQAIGESDLPPVIKQTSLAIFRRLSQAQAAVYPGRPEPNPLSRQTDNVLVVVGVVAGLSLLGIDRVECSPVHVGGGMTYGPDGMKPGLSPVAAEILRTAQVPVYGSRFTGEQVTPIGAAIITTIASAFGAIPAMKISSVGYGAGRDDLREAPNLVRLFIGETISRHDSVSTPAPTLSPATARAKGSPPVPEPVSMEAKSNHIAPPTPVPSQSHHDERAAMAVQGHQQSGRQRLAS
jgi:pyridinium-3,5-bisthiocarboxylic acid mononucleotide nickel chelatase